MIMSVLRARMITIRPMTINIRTISARATRTPNPPDDSDDDSDARGRNDNKGKHDKKRRRSPSSSPSSSSSSSDDDSSSNSISGDDQVIKGKKEADKLTSVFWPTVSQVEESTIHVAKMVRDASAYGDQKDITWLL